MIPAMSSRILFLGGGAIGSYLGAFLSRSGHDVTIVDMWPEHVEAIRERGISVTGPHEPFVAQPTALHVHEAQRLAANFDIAFVAMKAYDTAWATHMTPPRRRWLRRLLAELLERSHRGGHRRTRALRRARHVEDRRGAVGARPRGARRREGQRLGARRLPRGRARRRHHAARGGAGQDAHGG